MLTKTIRIILTKVNIVDNNIVNNNNNKNNVDKD